MANPRAPALARPHLVQLTRPSDKALLMLLASLADDNTGIAYPSQKWLMEIGGFSRSTVVRALQKFAWS